MQECTNAKMHIASSARCAFVHSCIRAFLVLALEGLSECDEPGRTVFARLGIELEAQVEPNRADRRFVSKAEPGRGPQREQVDVGGMRKHVTKVDEPDSLKPTVNRTPQLEVKDRLGVAADRKLL